jgi:hypothetical protein
LRVISFDDLKKYFGLGEHWAKTQIISLATLGIVEGYTDNSFRPQQAITRGEFATWLCRATKLKTSLPEKDVFFDVPKEHWRAPYIKAVVDAGYMKGQKDNIFGVDSTFKRTDAALMIAKAFKLPVSPTEQSPFRDVDNKTDNAVYIYAAYKGGFIQGTSKWRHTFSPYNDLKRAEAVTILSRLGTARSMRAALYDFNAGYGQSRMCKISTRPSIASAMIVPGKVLNNGRAAIRISAEVTDLQGSDDISQVWADLTELGGPFNAAMSIDKNNYYFLVFSVSSEVHPGDKNVIINTIDKTGLKSTKPLSITILGQ